MNNVTVTQILKRYQLTDTTNNHVEEENKKIFKPIIDSFVKTIRQLNAALLTPGIDDDTRKILKEARKRFYKRLNYFLATDAANILTEYNDKNECLKGVLSQMEEDDPARGGFEIERKFACLVLTLCTC